MQVCKVVDITCLLIIWQLFPTHMQHHKLKLDSNIANSIVMGY